MEFKRSSKKHRGGLFDKLLIPRTTRIDGVEDE